MSFVAYAVLAVIAVAALVVYQLVKGKKPVTVANVVTAVKSGAADAVEVKADVK